MIQSMTGYVKTFLKSDEIEGFIECRSLNHRYLDCRLQLPREIQYLEAGLRSLVQQKIERGRLEVSVQLNYLKINARLDAQPEVLKVLHQITQELAQKWNLNTSCSLQDLLNIKALQHETVAEFNTATVEGLLKQQFENSLVQLVQMRAVEGGQIIKRLQQHLQVCETELQQIILHQQEVPKIQAKLLKENLNKLNLSVTVDQSRIAQEIGLMLNRLDITEEIHRFSGHLEQVKPLMQQNGQPATKTKPIGKKLDFIMQELNREANTICSKTSALKIVEHAVNLKVEIEKMREQVQNIE